MAGAIPASGIHPSKIPQHLLWKKFTSTELDRTSAYPIQHHQDTMAAQTATKKRKSIGESSPATKKVKTIKSADKDAPAKSALKKSRAEPAVKPASKPASKPGKPLKPVKVAKEKTAVAKVNKDAAEIVAVDEVDQVDAAKNDSTELTADQTEALLAGFSSSEDEDSDAEDQGIDVQKLPQAPRTKDVQKQIEAATKTADPERTPGVVYIGRIPHGFYETQMRAYFAQFGEILHLRLARNRKSGQSQHYGFIEFKSAAVAEIVAKTMDKYLLFGHLLQARTVPREQVKDTMWKRSGRRKKPAPRNKLEGSSLRRPMVRDGWDKRIEREAEKRAAKAKVLEELGYEFEAPALKGTSEIPVKPKEIEAAPQQEEGVGLIEAAKEDETAQSEPVTESKAEKKKVADKGSVKKSKKKTAK